MRLGIRRKLIGTLILVGLFPLAMSLVVVLGGGAAIQLNRIRKRFFENYRAELSWDDSLVEEIASRCTEVESGARNIEYILSRGLLPRLSAHVLSVMAEGGQVGDLKAVFDDKGQFEFVSPEASKDVLAAAQ